MQNEPTEAEKVILWELSQVKASVKMVQSDIIRLTMQASGASDADVLKETRNREQLVHGLAVNLYKKSIQGLAPQKDASFPPPFSDN